MADKPDFTDQYNTPLNTYEQYLYDRTFPDVSARRDYDMQGWFKDNMKDGVPPEVNAEGQHYPDTFKKPSHPTFSNESIYHGVDGHEGGQWKQYENGDWSFTPGKSNLDLNGIDRIQDYLTHSDPNVVLLPPPMN